MRTLLIGLMSMISGMAAAAPACPDIAPTETIGRQVAHCKGGGTASCYQLGEAYTKGQDAVGKKLTPNPACAVEFFALVCTDKERSGCGPVGRAYVLGAGVPKDEAKGRALLERVCAEGDCLALAELYRSGGLTPAGPPAARKAAWQACKQGDAESCDYLESLMPACPGAGGDQTCTVRRYAEGCRGGSMVSCRMLGVLYVTGGALVPKNTDKALRHLRAACTSGDKLGCAKAGDLIFELHSNWEPAKELWLRACELGDKPSCPKSRTRPSHPRDRDPTR
jgi:uncharacterized protein